jgi:hypothetical protein
MAVRVYIGVVINPATLYQISKGKHQGEIHER